MSKRTAKQSSLPLFDENNFSFQLENIGLMSNINTYSMVNGELTINDNKYYPNFHYEIYEVVIQYARLRHLLRRGKANV